MPFSSGKMVAAPNFKRPRILVTQGQWAVLGMLLATLALEFIFSPYWHEFYRGNIVTGGGKDKAVSITSSGLYVMVFLLFGTFVILLLTGINQRAGMAIAGLLLLSVVLARAAPIIDWMDETTEALRKASGTYHEGEPRR